MRGVQVFGKRLIAFLIGIIVVGLGLLIGMTSYQVTYQSIANQQIQHYISGDDSNGNTSYIQMAGSGALFVVYEKDFSPQVSNSDLGSGIVSFTYRDDYAISVDVTATSGDHLIGKGYKPRGFLRYFAKHQECTAIFTLVGQIEVQRGERRQNLSPQVIRQ